MSHWWVNGVAGESVSASDRGFGYGDGLFETIAVRGGRCRFLPAHLQRLNDSCRRLQLPSPDQGRLTAALDLALKGADNGSLKLIWTRGAADPGYALPQTVVPTLAVCFSPVATVVSPVQGIRVRYCATRISRNPALAGMKTLNRLEQVLARAEWQDESYAEGLMQNDRDEVVCGTMSNLFAVTGNCVITPSVEECGIAGIMRQQLLEVATTLGVKWVIGKLTPAMLEKADDLFLSNTRIGMWPVAELAGSAYMRAPLTLQLRQALADRGVMECA